MEMPQLHRPTPRRVFDFPPASAESSRPPSPPFDSPRQSSESGFLKPLETPSSPPSRARSILNLTSSTLAGIYSKTTGDGGREEPYTPWGTGAQTPAIRGSIDGSDRQDFFRINFEPQIQKARTTSMRRPRSGFKGYYLPLLWQTLSLFLSGIGFGLLVTHLQRTQHITPVPVPAFARTTWGYQISWGILGIIVGNILPQIDAVLGQNDDAIIEGDADIQALKKTLRTRSNASDEVQNNLQTDNGLGLFWLSVIRSIGAFVGIAFAVRRVPWQSTLQVSLTLAAVNPVLWYLIDRSKSGFALSSVIGIVGSVLLLLFSPEFVPVPAIHQDVVSEKFGVYTWLASILFCTSLCFGAIGRRLHFAI